MRQLVTRHRCDFAAFSTAIRLMPFLVISCAFVAGDPQPVAAQERADRAAAAEFRFEKNDRVILLGGTFVERAQRYGHLETELLLTQPDAGLVFRNLGWSADTVFCDSRGIFDSPAAGYARMLDQVRELQPTVIVLNYGQNEFLDPAISLESFVTQYQKLVDDLQSVAPKSRMVIWSPHAFFYASPPLPDNRRLNAGLAEWVEATGRLAMGNGFPFVDLHTSLESELLGLQEQALNPDDAGALPETGDNDSQTEPAEDRRPVRGFSIANAPDLKEKAASYWTDNGMHFNRDGYELMARVVRRRWLGIPQGDRPAVAFDPLRREFVLSNGVAAPDGSHRVSGTRLTLALTCRNSMPLLLQLAGLDQPNLEPWTVAVVPSETSPSPAAQSADIAAESIDVRQHSLTLFSLRRPWIEQLRRSVVEKNRLYFHRWRPQNVTYLFGFRKHEQGQNAKEVAEFDVLVAEAERSIREHLRSDETMTIEISSED